jgi:DNA polymerase/3'-5' exonuclease PolX
MRHGSAYQVAEALVETLRPACTRIEIAGSVRREKGEVKDIEIVAIPDLTPLPRPRPEFGKPAPKVHKTALDQIITQMVDDNAIALTGNGDRYKKFFLKYAGINVDLFLNVPPSHWGVQMVIRTGPKEFSQWLVMQRQDRGALPNGHFVKHQVVWVASEIRKEDVPDDPNKSIAMLTRQNHLAMAEEIDFLKFCGLGWVEPRNREARWRS